MAFRSLEMCWWSLNRAEGFDCRNLSVRTLYSHIIQIQHICMTFMYGEKFAGDDSVVQFLRNAYLWFRPAYKPRHVGIFGIIC